MSPVEISVQHHIFSEFGAEVYVVLVDHVRIVAESNSSGTSASIAQPLAYAAGGFAGCDRQISVLGVEYSCTLVVAVASGERSQTCVGSGLIGAS